MLRSFLISLSQSQQMRRFVIHNGPARRMARRFIAGETLDEAVAVVRDLNRRGIMATLDHLGENVASQEDARRAAQEYQQLLQRIAHEGILSTISVKLTHVGLDFGLDFCHQQVRAIVEKANELGLTVEVDIEGSQYAQATLDIFHRLLDDYHPLAKTGDYRNLRLALQAYLFRTEKDLKEMIERGSSVRLCKGAYDEPPTLAWQTKADVDASYARLMDMTLGPLAKTEPALSLPKGDYRDSARKNGFYPAFGTHDHNLILRAEREAARQGIGKDRFEFQMLHGVRRDWQQRLADDGYRVRVYVPYGAQWYPYFMRRLAERPANVLFIARAFVGR